MSPVPGTHATHGPIPAVPAGHTGTIKLGALVYPGFDLLDVMGSMRIFGEELNTLNIEIVFVSHSLVPCFSAQQVKIAPHYTLESAPKLDIFFIPGGKKSLSWQQTQSPKIAVGIPHHLNFYGQFLCYGSTKVLARLSTPKTPRWLS